MAPYGSRRRRTRSTTRETRSSQLKKKQENSENQEISNALPLDDSSLLKKIDEGDKMDNSVEISNNGCSTPKGKKFRIPRINTCPPAPMKRRSSPLASSKCSLRRTPIAFFAPPDLELFFFFASDLCVNDGVGSSF